ncbi:MAG: bifunctional DNA primase/polymerase [Pirellulales bacterium]
MNLSVKQTALKLNELGLPITLCNGKAPIGTREHDNESIIAEFRRNPNLNVGLQLGPRSGIIDIEGDEDNSESDFRELFGGYDVPRTPMCKSRRGTHRLFAWDDRLNAIGKATVKYKSVEIRLGAGGKAAQSLVAPSETDGSAQGPDLFYCFSGNAQPFEQAKTYSKFAAYTVLNHQRDFSAAAAALAVKGYGSSVKAKTPSVAMLLIDLASGVELFHSPGGDAFATFQMKSSGHCSWLHR